MEVKFLNCVCLFRYVALREILMYHVGYESFYDEVTHMYNYAIRENLKMYYSSMTGAGKFFELYLDDLCR